MYYSFYLNGENATEKFNVGINASDALGLWFPEKKERQVALEFEFTNKNAIENYKSFLTAIYSKEIQISFPDGDSYNLKYKKSSPSICSESVNVTVWFDLK